MTGKMTISGSGANLQVNGKPTFATVVEKTAALNENLRELAQRLQTLPQDYETARRLIRDMLPYVAHQHGCIARHCTCGKQDLITRAATVLK